MKNPVPLHNPKQFNNPVTEYMQDVLAGTYGLYLATHNYHWNVEGSKFVQLHELFEHQYNELFIAVDVIAERIRAMGDYALPAEGEDILKISKMTSSALNKETNADQRADRMVNNLIAMNETVVKSCQEAKEEFRNAHDDESENLMIERITVHQKALWMLRSIVK